MAAPRCLYCGEALDAAAVASAAASREATLAPAPPDGPPRALVVLDARADPEALARALGESPYEGAQRARRGGLQLWRAVPVDEGPQEVARLRVAGVAGWSLEEAEVRKALRPQRAGGGSLENGVLSLRGEAERLALTAKDLVLVVKGPIAREYQPPDKARRMRTASLEPGYRYHLHRRADVRPVELDPAEFDFGPAPGGGSAHLQLAAWIDAAAAGVPVDDEFRRLPPAFGPAQGEGSVAAALDGRSSLRRRPQEGRVVLDNLGQFHFHSAWRGVVERRR
jgi:hypothetical protein